MTFDDNKVFFVPGFLPKNTCREVTAWVKSVEDQQFVLGITRNEVGTISRTDRRLTNRISGKVEYDQKVYDIQEKIKNFMGLGGCPVIDGHGRDGVVISITKDGGDVYPHRDPGVGENLAGLRCNILMSNAEKGGVVYVNEIPYTPDTGDLMCYLVTQSIHRVTECRGATDRIMCMFGWKVKENAWHEGTYIPKGDEK